MNTKVINQIEVVAFLYQQKFKNRGFIIENNRVGFEFEDSPELEEAIYSYQQRKARVDPFEFNLHVKNVIHLSKEILKGVNSNGK